MKYEIVRFALSILQTYLCISCRNSCYCFSRGSLSYTHLIEHDCQACDAFLVSEFVNKIFDIYIKWIIDPDEYKTCFQFCSLSVLWYHIWRSLPERTREIIHEKGCAKRTGRVSGI